MAAAQAKGAESGLILHIRTAYWAALLIIAGMVTAAYLLLQQMMADHQHGEIVLQLASTQKALSQRIVYLATAAETAPDGDKEALVDALKSATAEFERNYDQLLERTAVDTPSSDPALKAIFFARPHNLDHFSVNLVDNSRRLLAMLEHDAGLARTSGFVGDRVRASLDVVIANTTLAGYVALADHVANSADRRLDGLLATHRTLFYATLGVLLLIGLFIFQPMSRIIGRKTRELIDARNSMAFIAVHDGLTGLYNRAFLIDHFDTVLKGAKRRRERFAILQLDLDRFKQINDTLGHAAGDMVLVRTAERMRDSCRASDLCVRLGGDEFVMVLGAVGTSEDIAMVTSRILEKINEPIDFGGATIYPGASAGIAVYPVDGTAAGDLLVHADLALYAAKRQGGGAFSFFSDELRKELEHRKQLEGDIKTAIAERGFDVYFQPQMSLADGRITGVEALVRWDHPERGMIPPSDFIPIAEKTGLMTQIGRIVFAKAIARAAEWHRDGLNFGRLALNVSGAELREPDFSDFLFDTMREAGLPPEKLALEIVESVILDDDKTGVAGKLRKIRAAGIHLELDDFGTGYASLAHVNPNEIDRLKIDRRFVQNIDANGDNTKIVRAITELARGLGISIVAEGAETDAELSSLLSIGCEEVQGYSIAFPMPETQARDWLAAHTPKKPVLRVHEKKRA